MAVLRIASLCSGYGGLELAAQAGLGVEQVEHLWLAEVDPAASRVLAARFPGTPNLGDIMKIPEKRIARPGLLTMGVPCQAVSAAGRQKVEEDHRWLWPSAARVLDALRPPLVLFENVRNLVSIRGGAVWNAILADLREVGYRVVWLTMGACVVGAPHHRHRVFAFGLYEGPGAPPARRLAVPECGAPKTGGRLLPTPRVAATRTSRGAMIRENSRSAPSLEQAVEIAQGILPRELNDWAEAPASWQPHTLLPTPVARDGDGRGEGGPEYWDKRKEHRSQGVPLGVAVSLLPTPCASPSGNNQGGGMGRVGPVRHSLDSIAHLLPTPQSRDGDRRTIGSPEVAQARLDSGRRNLDDAVALLPTPNASDATSGPAKPRDRHNGPRLGDVAALLPTPRASDGKNGGPNQGIASGDIALSSAVQPERWGVYAEAVALWEHLYGADAPDATVAGPRGGQRLNPVFAEWMMGLDLGWVTAVDGLHRRDQLRLIGNGVAPAQGAYATSLLVAAARERPASCGKR